MNEFQLAVLSLAGYVLVGLAGVITYFQINYALWLYIKKMGGY